MSVSMKEIVCEREREREQPSDAKNVKTAAAAKRKKMKKEQKIGKRKIKNVSKIFRERLKT